MKFQKCKTITLLITIVILILLSSNRPAFAQSQPIEIAVPYIDSSKTELYVNQGGWLSGYRTSELGVQKEEILKWTTSDSSILKIYEGPKGSIDCAFVAKKAGVVTITATDSTGYKEKISLTVVENAPEGISIGKRTVKSNGEAAILYYEIFTINNNQKHCAGLLVNESTNFCVSIRGTLEESATDAHIYYMENKPLNLTGSWEITMGSRSFRLKPSTSIINTFSTTYSVSGYYDNKNKSVLTSGYYDGTYFIKSKKYGINQSYSIIDGWKYNKFKYYSNRQLMVRYAYYNLFGITRSSCDTIAQIDNDVLNYNRADLFRNEFESFENAQYYGTPSNPSAKYGEDTSKSPLNVEEGTLLAQALEKYCGVSTVAELPTILPVDQAEYNWPDLGVGNFSNYYVITTGENAGNIVYVGDDGSGVKDENGVIWFGLYINI